MSEHRCPRVTPKGDAYKEVQQLRATSRLLAGPNEMRGLMLRKTPNGTTLVPVPTRKGSR